MQRFDRAQIIRFLHALDLFLEDNLAIFVVGGLAAVLGYHADIKTADMDVLTITEGSAADLKQAARQAFKLTGIDFSIGGASIAELPYNYEDRVRPARGTRFHKLTVTVPDKYDLVLSKALRCYAHDLEAIHSVHDHHHLSEKTLAARFETGFWKIATTDPRNFALNMFVVMGTLFGEERAAFYKIRWGLDRSR